MFNSGKDLGRRKASQSLPNRSVTDSSLGTASALLDNIWQQLSKSLKALMVTDLSTRDKLQISFGSWQVVTLITRGCKEARLTQKPSASYD